MGQRHQIYVRLKRKNSESTIGIHHQWLYGQTAVRQLRNFLTFCSKQSKYGPFTHECYYSIKESERVLESLYSTDYENGYYHPVHRLDEETENPLLGDNNDGITVIDLTESKPQYCFVSLNGLEGNGKQPPTLKPLSAIDYLQHYYPKMTDDIDFENESARVLADLQKFSVMSLSRLKTIFPLMFSKRSEMVGSK